MEDDSLVIDGFLTCLLMWLEEGQLTCLLMWLEEGQMMSLAYFRDGILRPGEPCVSQVV